MPFCGFQSGKALLGDIMYHYLCADKLSPECLVDYLDLSSEYSTLEIANRIEASVHIWKLKHLQGHKIHRKGGKSSWRGKVKSIVSHTRKYKFLAQRAETLLQKLRQKFPGLPQTDLDMSKIQYNKVCDMSSKYNIIEELCFIFHLKAQAGISSVGFVCYGSGCGASNTRELL